MGNWYTNIALKDADAGEVLQVLRELGRHAIVNPARSAWSTVYDEECEKFDLEVLESLALTLAKELNCAAFASFNADDDMLWLGIYEGGRRASRYASSLREFEDASEFPKISEFAGELCRVFDKPEAAGHVRSILGRGHGALGFFNLLKIRLAYLFEIHRHMDLAKVLPLPSASVGLGFRYVARGELAEGMNAENLLKTVGRQGA